MTVGSADPATKDPGETIAVTANTTVKALWEDHSWGEVDYKWADDNSTVTATRVCKHDGAHVESETAKATSEVTTEPTETAEGVRTYTATFDNPDFAKQTKTEPVPVKEHEHVLTHVAAGPATCTEDGVVEHWVCDQGDNPCGLCFSDVEGRVQISQEDTVAKALGHDWGEWSQTVVPTCSAMGKEERVCERDSDHKEARDVDIDPDAHDWGEWETVTEPTETKEGSEKRTCKCDPEHTETQAIPVKGHVHVLTKVEAVDATCEADGVVEHWVCNEGENPCGRLFGDAQGANEVDAEDAVAKATGHKWGAWAATTPASCTEKGTEARTCANDDQHVETREVDALDHAWGEPTYEWADGNKAATATRTCANDASHAETEVAEAASEVTLEPTETAEGVRTYTASFDNPAFATQTRTEAIPKLDPKDDPDDGSDSGTDPSDDQGADSGTDPGDDSGKDPEPGTDPGTNPGTDPTDDQGKDQGDDSSQGGSIAYRNTEGSGNVWTKGSGRASEFVFKRSAADASTFAHFTGIQVDGQDVDPASYEARSGSVVVGLKPAYLETLAVGDHTMTALFDDGNSASARVTIVAAQDGQGDGNGNGEADDSGSGNGEPGSGGDNGNGGTTPGGDNGNGGSGNGGSGNNGSGDGNDSSSDNSGGNDNGEPGKDGAGNGGSGGNGSDSNNDGSSDDSGSGNGSDNGESGNDSANGGSNNGSGSNANAGNGTTSVLSTPATRPAASTSAASAPAAITVRSSTAKTGDAALPALATLLLLAAASALATAAARRRTEN